MTLDAQFNLKCDFGWRSLLNTYLCFGLRSWPCVTEWLEWTWALAIGEKMWPMNC